MSTEEDFIDVGKIVGTFGLKGGLKVQVTTDFVELLEPGQNVLVDGAERTITDLQWHKSQARIWIEGIKKIEQAEPLIGAKITFPTSELPPLGEDEYLIRDLIGIEVFDEDGNKLGTLDEVYPGPAQDVYRVGKLLVPAVKEFVLSIDLGTRRMTLRVIPGMDDLA
jgi:16S rRNA processing protein RimM